VVDLKLLGRGEDSLENEMKIVKAISKDMNMYFGLEICPRICFKKGRVQSETYIGSVFQKDIQELDLSKACKY